MPHLLLVIEDEDRRAQAPAERRRRFDEMMRFTEDLETRGVLLASESLRPASEGVRVQRRDGRSLMTDGPFAEAKEMIGGFFLLDCDDRDEALEIAGECPASGWGTVEVRATGRCIDD